MKILIKILLFNVLFFTGNTSSWASKPAPEKPLPSNNVINEKLRFFACQGDYKGVTTALQAGASVNAQHENGWTPLAGTVFIGNQDIAKLLINKKAEVNSKANDGTSPLHTAVFKNHKPIIQLLLENKADIDIKDNNGFTPLHHAACAGNKSATQLLLNKKANVNSNNKDGFSALDCAIANNNTAIAQLLRAHRAQDHEMPPPSIEIQDPLVTQNLSTMLPVDANAIIEAIENAAGKDQKQLKLALSLLFIHYNIIEFYLTEQLLIQTNQANTINYVREVTKLLLIKEFEVYYQLTSQLQGYFEGLQKNLSAQDFQFNFKSLQSLLFAQQEFCDDINSLSSNLDKLNKNFEEILSDIKKIKSLQRLKSQLPKKVEGKDLIVDLNTGYIDYLLNSLQIYEKIRLSLEKKASSLTSNCDDFLQKINIFLDHGKKFSSLHVLMKKNASCLRKNFIYIYEKATLFKTFYALCYHKLRSKLIQQPVKGDEKKVVMPSEVIILQKMDQFPDELWSMHQILTFNHGDKRKICSLMSDILKTQCTQLDQANPQSVQKLEELNQQLGQLLADQKTWGNSLLVCQDLKPNIPQDPSSQNFAKNMFKTKAQYLIKILSEQQAALALQNQAPDSEASRKEKAKARKLKQKKKKQQTQKQPNKPGKELSSKAKDEKERKVEVPSVDQAQETMQQLSLNKAAADDQDDEDEESAALAQSDDLKAPSQPYQKALAWRKATDEFYRYLFSSQERIVLSDGSVAIRYYDKAKYKAMWARLYKLRDEKKQPQEQFCKSLKTQGYSLDLPKQDLFHCFPEAILDFLPYGIKFKKTKKVNAALNQKIDAINELLFNPYDISTLSRGEEAFFLPALIAPTFGELTLDDAERTPGIHDGCYIFVFRTDKTCFHAMLHPSKTSNLRNPKKE